MSELLLRQGTETDEGTVLALFDEAVEWLVARGQTGQWGSEPMSERPAMRARVHRMATGGGLWIAERGGGPVGALVVGAAPGYVPPPERSELYIDLLLSSRRQAGTGIGSRLVAKAVELARVRDVEALRVDCWAGAPTLVAWYEREGFDRCGTVDVDGWLGQVFTRPVMPPRSPGSSMAAAP